ncbi:hypothetical protein KMP13_02280 [Epibacterium ulvae]|uniref:transcription termination/antitermination protein NusG n=1 Tax=Epibacterium ulvae TaxID=1156985 RepID=UPI001BFC1B5C|nr:hypothetical protein [Epibacterium ulvae]MBT8152741.1 hypothetical protein [Epibacterium ulvae]
MNAHDTQWFAVRTKPPVNSGRIRTIVGGDYETYVGRGGVRKQRLIPGTGEAAFVIEELIHKAGFRTFLPTQKVFRRKSRYGLAKRPMEYPKLPGWCFVEMPTRFNTATGRDEPFGWHRLLRLDVVESVVCVDGHPCPIHPFVIEDMARRWNNPPPGHHQHQPTHHEFDIGDTAVVSRGTLAGFAVDVTDIRDANAVVILDLLGKQTEHEIPMMHLEAA